MCKHEECLKDYEQAPEECTLKQIKECHGDIKAEDHPCRVKMGDDVE